MRETDVNSSFFKQPPAARKHKSSSRSIKSPGNRKIQFVLFIMANETKTSPSGGRPRPQPRPIRRRLMHGSMHGSKVVKERNRKWFSPRCERLPLLSLWMLFGAIGGSSGVRVDVDFRLVLLTLVVVSVLVAAGGRGCSVEVLLGVG